MTKIYTTVFIAGFSLMSLEIALSRVLSFYYGSSVFVWTAIIGVIMGGLSLGYWLGGKLDVDSETDGRCVSPKLFSLCGQSSLYTAIAILILDFVAQFLRTSFQSKLVSSLITCILLFSIPSIFMGMLSSFSAKVAVTRESKKGETTGIIFALSTLGSIAGTFLSGMVLIPLFGSKATLILSGLLPALITLFSNQKIKWVLPTLAISIFSYTYHYLPENTTVLFDKDSIFSRVMVVDNKTIYKESNQTFTWRELFINTRFQGGFYTDYQNLLFPFVDYMLLGAKLKNNVSQALMLGGGSYSLPMEFAKAFPSSHIDVVEIDPLVTDVAKKYFNFTPSPQMNIIHTDARIYLNENQKKFDIIFADVYKSAEPPFYLVTKEAYKKMFDSLNDNGWLVSNVVGSISGEQGKYILSVYKTMRTIFPAVYIFPTLPNYNGADYTNLTLIATKNQDPLPTSTDDPHFNELLSTKWTGEINDTGIVFTDDYSPAEYLAFSKNNQ